VPKSTIEGSPGEVKLLLGNEAIARGALEAGISIATAYPGTPSTEIVETLAEVGERYGVYVEWSVNEKVALEVAIGGSMMGLRALTAMKHVGVNVASDSLMSLGYAGALGGLVIVTADDPSAHSSQNEQDNRIYGIHSYIPVFEPASPQEAKDMTRDLFDLSEKYETAVFLRTTTRLAHSRGEVKLGGLVKLERKPAFHRDPERWCCLPPYDLVSHQKALDRVRRLEEDLSSFKYNWVEEGSKELAIVASGASYAYVKEALERLNINPTIFKLSSTFPLPRKLAIQALNFERVLVVEELEPVVEDRLKVIAYEEGLKAQIFGKNLIPRVRELSTPIVASAISKIAGVPYSPPTPVRISLELPARPPVLCAGCPHRATYYAVKLAVARSRIKPVYTNDIGCYSLGFYPPFNTADVMWCMGASLGIGSGIAKFSQDPVVAFIGDSTFYHAGIPGLINAVYNNIPLLVVVMDNGITAMTGHQPHPGSGYGPAGEPRQVVKIEDLARAAGVGFVEVVDAYNINEVRDVAERAIRYVRENKRPAVVISRRPCALIELRRKRSRGEEIVPYFIDQEKCIKCGVCVDKFSCPAIVREGDRILILPDVCVGCGVCASICPAKAIRPVKSVTG
jgi:indolepyruvate ferredoxin oxidoreductase alpha subunit